MCCSNHDFCYTGCAYLFLFLALAINSSGFQIHGVTCSYSSHLFLCSLDGSRRTAKIKSGGMSTRLANKQNIFFFLIKFFARNMDVCNLVLLMCVWVSLLTLCPHADLVLKFQEMRSGGEYIEAVGSMLLEWVSNSWYKLIFIHQYCTM